MSSKYYAYMTTARTLLEEGKESLSWLYLILAEDAIYEERKKPASAPRTARQLEIQKLWQERGQIEFAIANVRATIKALQRYEQFASATYLQKMEWELQQAVVFNKQQFATVSRRIPDDKNSRT